MTNLQETRMPHMLSITHKVMFLFGLIVLLIIFRHIYLYHLEDIKNLMIWMKNGLGWKAIIVGAFFYHGLLVVPCERCCGGGPWYP